MALSALTHMSLSEAQLAAVLDTSPKVLVSAAAGSGKTRLLVAYFIHALMHDGVSPEDLAAVTFTRKAAAELTERIRDSLRELGRDDLASALDRSTIGTIHSLCSRLVKADAFGATVDPAFSVIDADPARLLQQEALAEAWQREVREADDARLALLASYGDALKDEALPLYERLRGAGQYSPQIDLPLTAWGDTRGRLVAAIEEVVAAADELPSLSKTQSGNLDRVQGCLAWLDDVGHPGSLDAMEAEQRLRESADFLPKGNNGKLKDWFDPVKQALTAHREAMGQVILTGLIAAMNSLLSCFHQLYSSAKRDRGVMDFTDLELRAKRLADEAEGHRARFFGPEGRILVDEFQDTNSLQYQILEQLGASRLFMVGDEKQSIYRFRGADVAVFKARETELAGRQRENGSLAPQGLHRLATNYRSSEGVLAFVNDLFSHPDLFGTDFTRLEHGRPVEKDRARGSRVVDVIIAARSGEGPDAEDAEEMKPHEAEAHAVAERVRMLVDDEGWRPRDIAVLVPTLTHSPGLQKALRQQGVETYLVRGKGYYTADEVSDIRSILRVMVDTRDDLALMTVLRSPFVQLSDDALYLIGQARSWAETLWEAMTKSDHIPLAAEDRQAIDIFVASLARMSARVGQPGLAELIDDVISEFSYDVCVLLSEGGERRFANIRKLMGLADQYESLYGPDLAGFVEVMISMTEAADKEGNAPTLSEDEDVVRIMTVHQAKGLEFPVVVLAGLTSAPPPPERRLFMVGSDGTTAASLKYGDDRLSLGPVSEILEREREEESQEDLRALYVAMTRAQDRLVLVGSVPSKTRVKGSRIKRILEGLGIEGMPEAGTSAEVAAGATVSCVFASASGREGAPVAPAQPKPATAPTPVAAATSGTSDAARPAFAGETPALLPTPSLTVLPRRLSFSALDAFSRCPRRFYLERVLGLALDRLSGAAGGADGRGGGPPDEEHEAVDRQVWLDHEESGGALEVGLAVHSLLEKSALDAPMPDKESLRRLASQISAAQGRALSTADLGRALDLTQAFWRSPTARAPGVAQARKEESFLFGHDGVLLSGVLDLVWQQEGMWSIVDFKTNSLMGRTPESVAAGYELQACVYCLAAFAGGADEVHMDFLFLERPEAPVRVEHPSADREQLQGRLTAVLDEIRSSRFPALPGDACAQCPVAAFCY